MRICNNTAILTKLLDIYIFLSLQNVVAQKLIYISYSYWLLISTESFMGDFKSFGICYRSNGALIIPTDKKLE